MNRDKVIIGLIGLIGAAFALALLFVMVRDFKTAIALDHANKEKLVDDVLVCRLVTGIDDRFHQRRLSMACAHEVIEKSMSEGLSRGEAANEAAKSCIPDYSSCERVLKGAK